jgi:hypothetical protein
MGEVQRMSVPVDPMNDIFEHVVDDSGECWCEPEVQWVYPETGEMYSEALVIHNSADGRELTE